jgi:hypothetical protein
MPAEGLLLQLDGSRHDRLEGRGPWLTLVGAIDDATGVVPLDEGPSDLAELGGRPGLVAGRVVEVHVRHCGRLLLCRQGGRRREQLPCAMSATT